MSKPIEIWQAERPGFPLWLPVFIGLGVQLYFWSPVEPALWAFAVALCAPVLMWALFWRWLKSARLLGAIILLVSVGFCAAGFRAHHVAAPVLTQHLDTMVEGRVVSLNRSQSGRQRLLLDRLFVFGLLTQQTPDRIQVTIMEEDEGTPVSPGDQVSVLVRIGPPGGPVEPGGFDFRRMAWFQGLGGTGYAREAPHLLPPPMNASFWDRITIQLAKWRSAISADLREKLPGETGAVAAAITVGDRGGVSPETIDALRYSNLAHLLAISGLHMGMVTALVFALLRLALVLTPGIGKRWRVKAIAAAGALLAAFAYLALSGGSIATQRAFIMVAVALIGVMLNRPAITLRALSVAALVILLTRPESLLHVGFQMSFAATAAIVAGFDLLRARGWSGWISSGGWQRRIPGYIGALTMTSLLAGLATAPFAAFHFNQMAHYGLAANIVSVPIMGFIVAPSALAAAFLAPLGFDGWALSIMGYGLSAILSVAEYISALDGAYRRLIAAPSIVLPLVAIGGLALCLLRTRLRLAGGAFVAAALAIWLIGQDRPHLLVAGDGRLLGLMTEQGRALDHKSAQSYAGGQWLRRDGDLASNPEAARRPGFEQAPKLTIAPLSNGWRVVNTYKRLKTADVAFLCTTKTILISRWQIKDEHGDCIILSGSELRDLGAFSITETGTDVEVSSATQLAGQRFWTGYFR
ncbi:MAG: ComEC/Rec2 family competence protein [Pikeienuella sp.]